jgi:hypothetical protein
MSLEAALAAALRVPRIGTTESPSSDDSLSLRATP